LILSVQIIDKNISRILLSPIKIKLIEIFLLLMIEMTEKIRIKGISQKIITSGAIIMFIN